MFLRVYVSSDVGMNIDPDIFSTLKFSKAEGTNHVICTDIQLKRPDYTENRAVFFHVSPVDYTKLEFCIISTPSLDRRHLQRHSDGRQGFHDSSNSGITLAAFHPGYDRLLHSAQSLKLFLRDPLFTPCPDSAGFLPASAPAKQRSRRQGRRCRAGRSDRRR